jgi:predicted methyltransferase
MKSLLLANCLLFTAVAVISAHARVGDAARQDQHGAQSRDAIDRMRDRDLKPEQIMDVIGLRPGMTVGEAGASYGYFTFKMSRRIGPTGVVYANDIDARALETIRTRAASEKVANIRTVLGEAADPRFPRNDLEMIVVFDCLFEFTGQAKWMKSARKYLRPSGRLVIVDPDAAKMASPHFLSRQQVHEFARDAGFTAVEVDDRFLKTHMIVVLQSVKGTFENVQ